LNGICDIIEAKVLAVSDQDYDPWGASSLVLMSDIKGEEATRNGQSFHLDKSHICAHTYPDFREKGTICSFRIDIDIATCGEISPLKALNYMFDNFDSDVVVIDYVVRGYTRDANERKVYIDHEMQSIQNFMKPELLKDYYCADLALQSENIWQTKMIRTRLNEQSYFLEKVDPADPEIRNYLEMVKNEMRGLFYMWPE
jgi:S-adenosylmethionine decarboxylase